jgi:PAS domain-containing protein
MTVQACRFGDGVLVHWRQHDRQRCVKKRLDLLERAASCGWAEWDLATGAATWSDAVYEILQRDPRKGPVKLGALHRYVVPSDELALSEAVRAVTRKGQSADREVTLRRHGRTGRIRFVAEPVLDRRGRVIAVHTVFQRVPAC